MKLGLSTLLHRDRPLDRALLQDLRQAGVESIELTDYHPGFSDDKPDSFTDLRSALEDLGLHLNSLHIHLAHFDPDIDLAALAAPQREKALAAYRQAVELMAVLGGGILVAHGGVRIHVRPLAAARSFGRFARLGRQLDVELAQLLRRNHARRAHHQILRALVHREGDDLANIFFANQQSYQPIDAKSKASVRGCSVPKSVHEDAEFLLGFFLIY